MQAVLEILIGLIYLAGAVYLGVKILQQAKARKYELFGWMVLILAFGEAFRILPRLYALITVGVEAFYAPLGFGVLVASVTMTAFYIMLYHFWRVEFEVRGRHELTLCIYAFAVARIILVALPHNDWFVADSPMLWGLFRSLPILIMGAITAMVFYRSVQEANRKRYRCMYLAIALSFAFYLPAVLFMQRAWAGLFLLPYMGMNAWIIGMVYWNQHPPRVKWRLPFKKAEEEAEET